MNSCRRESITNKQQRKRLGLRIISTNIQDQLCSLFANYLHFIYLFYTIVTVYFNFSKHEDDPNFMRVSIGRCLPTGGILQQSI